MDIQELKTEALPDAQRLIWETFMIFEAPDYAQEGIDMFKKCLYDPAFLAQLTFYGAYRDTTLLGVLAMREGGRHISMFFVRPDCQQQGIGRQLFDYTLKNTPLQSISVNASPFAVGIYKKLGFRATDAEQLADGIRYTPMVYNMA